MLQLRLFEPRDLAALYAISLATGHAGGDASHLYADGQLVGHIYAAPYASLQPDFAFVVEDGDGVGGFVVGTLDTALWESRLEQIWWPDLRRRYACPCGAPELWTIDEKRHAMIHHPEHAPVDVVRDYPAHIHLNLLPRLQRRGVGVRLLAMWLESARARDANAIHIGVNHRNAGALTFWKRQGFLPLATASDMSRTIWMGRCITD
jgi:ribosomal protein S18 acetylase RimI-like enzyme